MQKTGTVFRGRAKIIPPDTFFLPYQKRWITAAELIALAAEQLALNHAKVLCDAIVKNFNTGTPSAGRCAISPTTKRLYVYCADNLWHALIPASSDGVQMPTIEEEGVKNVL